MSCKVFSSSDEYGLGGSGIQASKVGPDKTGSSSKSSKSDEEDSVKGDSDGDGDPSQVSILASGPLAQESLEDGTASCV